MNEIGKGQSSSKVEREHIEVKYLLDSLVSTRPSV